MERSSREPIEFQVKENISVTPDSEKAPSYNIAPKQGFSVFNSEGDILFKGKVASVVADLKRELYPIPFTVEEKIVPVEEKKIGLGYEKKKVFPLILILIINIVVLAAACMSYFLAGEKVGMYVAPFVKEGALSEAVSYIDGLVAFLGYVGIDLGIVPVLNYDMHADTFSWAMTGFFAISYVLVLVFALVHVIASIVALGGRKKEGVYKKRRMGWTSIVMLLLSVIGLIGLAFCQGQPGFGEIASLFMLKEMTGVGIPRADYVLLPSYGLYGLLGASIITLICSSTAYKGYTGGKKC